MRRLAVSLLLSTTLAGAAAAETPHNIVLFIADGLRPGMVTPEGAPAMHALMERGVRFTNTHSVFPTFTTANAAAMSTSHMPGDNGDFSNTIYAGFPIQAAAGASTPFVEADPVLIELDQHFNGNYLTDETFLAAAREKGMATAAIGKVGPVLIFDSTEAARTRTVIVDDQTGRGGVPLLPDVAARLQALNLPVQAPTRGDNAPAGNNTTPGTLTPNTVQQTWFADVATKAVLPLLKQNPKGFVMVFWSRDPDGSQHNQGDSLNRLMPGINGPTSRAAIRNADNDLAEILAALKEQGLEASTDVVLTSDHGFSTISKESVTSFAATQTYKGVNPGMLPPGFVALYIAHALYMKLSDPNNKNAEVPANAFPLAGNGLIGPDPAKPVVAIAANGGSDLIYVPGNDKATIQKIVALLAAQDYTSGLFVDDAAGKFPGTLPLSAIGMKGVAATPTPTIAINFTTYARGCADRTVCGVEVADTTLQHGQGMHGSFGRADTENTMAAAGPDFRTHFQDPAPVGNVDLGITIAHILGLKMAGNGTLKGRVLTEAMPNGAMPQWKSLTTRSEPGPAGQVTVLRWQQLNEARYFDAAGYPGRSIGLER